MSVLDQFLQKVVTQIVNPLILLMTAVAFLVFMWGAFQFVYHAADDKKREEGRHAFMWGLIGFVIIFGAYGIINVAMKTFNLMPNGKSTIQGVLGR